MTSPIPVHIYFVLDRSGSMQSMREATVKAFDDFIAEQKATPGKCRLTMIQFDGQDPSEMLYDATLIAEVGSIADRFQPRGMTPLYDAEGWLITRAAQRERTRAANGKKAEAILFVTLTDGGENASREYTGPAIVKLKEEAESRGWAFTYLGANQDAYETAADIGVPMAAASNFVADDQGVSNAVADVSNLTSNYRSRASKGMRTNSSDLYAGVERTADADWQTRVGSST